MAYLNSPRLSFSGTFQADPSTVNNDPTHYNNDEFIPSYQDYQEGENQNGWWNPDGTGNWRFVDCKVKQVTYLNGESTMDPSVDPIIGLSITDANARVAGKIVDLDPQQQMVSMLWGFEVKLMQKDQCLFSGAYKPAAFRNIWFGRSIDLSADGAACAIYQSVLENVSWNIDGIESRYLKELKASSSDELSINFTVDRYNGNFQSSQFTLGRIVGTIGPSKQKEPKFQTVGRQLAPLNQNDFGYALAVLEESTSSLILDMSNALQVNKEEGHPPKTLDYGELAIGVNTGTSTQANYVYLGKIDYQTQGWYLEKSGVMSLVLDKEQFAMAQNYPMIISKYLTSQLNTFTLVDKSEVLYQEQEVYAFADQFVYRMNPGDTAEVDFYVTDKGQLAGDTVINMQVNPAIFGQQPEGLPLCVPNILEFSPNFKTDKNGKVVVPITAGDPENPRKYIDGQVYGLSYNLNNMSFDSGNQSNFLSVMVYDAVPEDVIKNPDWDLHVQPIMQQYANLYPLMSKGIFNLADKKVVDSNAQILKLVFAKNMEDPNYMPATRDLSRDRSQMILNYLDSILNKTDIA